MSSVPLLELQNVGFWYNGRQVLKGVSFQVQEGDYLGILGPNGSGKTTLLKIMLGILSPQEGSVRARGKEVLAGGDFSVFGYVPQHASHAEFRFPVTVRELVSSGRVPQLPLFGRFKDADRKMVEQSMRTVGILELQNRRVDDLSGGERQKAFIARALAGNPKILILDEPLTGVDTASQELFYDFLRDLNEVFRITIILVSHDVDVLAQQVKSILCLRHELLYYGSSSDLTKEELVEKLYGSKVKFFPHKENHHA
ncbi:MAG: metal ABC transporter ATP-binding protein [Candidatus Yanofskybacteria bacterium]|nr:metal ABC transporter ATP-binding protein [Candidatus Yanofskybacteria bacterium]